MADTGIEWTDRVWNPVTGCTKVSAGCKNCYAEQRVWPRLSAAGMPYEGRQFTDVQCHPERLGNPLHWKKPRRVFVNSVSDLFHEDVPFEFIASVFAVMAVTTRHTYQVLTKRPQRMLEFFRWVLQAEGPDGDWYPITENEFGADERIGDCWPADVPWSGYDNCGPVSPYENVWLGVSAEDQDTLNERVRLLQQTPAVVRFVSLEPLLSAVDFRVPVDGGYVGALCGALPAYPPLDWVIVGVETGPKARPTSLSWVRALRDQCRLARVAFFFKQWGEWAPTPLLDGMTRCGRRRAGRMLDGRTWEEFPQPKTKAYDITMENRDSIEFYYRDKLIAPVPEPPTLDA